ncbi:MAG TPA: hypothetical protein VHW66_03260 [Stellaceae bacterium]|jgi:hypothetical protein|nr:hypothetical protein [Stellaceae bacterium]
MTSRAWYGVAVVALLAGLGAAGWTVWHGVGGMAGSFMHLLAPGSTTLNLAETGSYTIFQESPGTIDGKVYVSDHIGGLTIAVTAPGGASVPVHAPSGNATYNYGGRQGVAFLGFDITAPGQYRVTASYPASHGGDQAVLAIEHGFAFRLLGIVLKAVGFGLGGVIAALVIFLVTFIRRARQRRRLAAAR